eukprot:3749695-Rhodomonas_salina.8
MAPASRINTSSPTDLGEQDEELRPDSSSQYTSAGEWVQFDSESLRQGDGDDTPTSPAVETFHSETIRLESVSERDADGSMFNVDGGPSSTGSFNPGSAASIKSRYPPQFSKTKTIAENSVQSVSSTASFAPDMSNSQASLSLPDRLNSQSSYTSGTFKGRKSSGMAFNDGDSSMISLNLQHSVAWLTNCCKWYLNSCGDSDDENAGRRTSGGKDMRRRMSVAGNVMGESEFDRQAITSWIADMISYRLPTLMRAYIEAVLLTSTA